MIGVNHCVLEIVIFLNIGVKSVFDFVFWPPWNPFADLRPTTPKLRVIPQY